ncbi:TPA: fimbrial protein [Pseudomonas aeruginosa]|nr:fimbrial protein [Pseudomonas aeruginosa]
MKTIVRFVLLGVLLVLSQKSFALICWKPKTHEAVDKVYMDSNIAVPSVLPKDAVLWRSPNYSFDIECFQDRDAGPEQVYFYLSPDGQAALGSDLEVGINLNGEDLRCSTLAKCRKEIGMHFDGCWTGRGCEGRAKTMRVNFNFFLSKRVGPSTGKEGPIAGADNYAIFQFDGENGINATVGYNFRMYLYGLNKLRYVACASTLGISPKTVDFQTIQSYFATRDQTIKELPFRLTASKNCNSAYALGAMFMPASNTTLSGTDTLLAKDNPSVGIRLLRQEDRSVIDIGKEFELVPYSKDQQVVRNFLAQLRWMTGKPTPGQFNAGATIEVYYK